MQARRRQPLPITLWSAVAILVLTGFTVSVARGVDTIVIRPKR